ncbi:MAG: NAD-binding protein [Candidatus Marinimicrobia bacterium]|nr:NAD-binding protein [FCB group bacterium]MBL7026459.1 NAD-binding protein [Candidatus Neomarinimicrobiota bacterium]
MKLIFSELIQLVRKKQERNIWQVVKFFIALMAMVTIYSIIFHFLMALENQQFSWITGFYWTLTVMSTLGFGDITFATDLGKIFSILVLMSGVVFLLTMLPFTLIQFFYLPWVEAQAKARAPRQLPEGTKDHVILTSYDSVTINLAEKFRKYNYEYVVVVEDVQQALDLQDLNLRVVVGELGNPQTYQHLKVEDAALVVANVDDMMNTNIAFTVREISQKVPLIANADLDDSVDILELSGCTYVFQFTKMLGQSLARRVLGTSTKANVIGKIGSLLIAEATTMRTALVGKTLMQSELRKTIGVNVVGVWERGVFTIPTPQTLIKPTTVLLLAGSAEQFSEYDAKFGGEKKLQKLVLIVGGGRVGQAAGDALHERNIDYRIIEKQKSVIGDERYIYGSAADINTLIRAGIKEASSILITTHDDPTNIYLTIYCRRLRPDAQIISRASIDGNISKLHTAGADLVMSYASLTANTIINLLKPDKLLMVAEGLNVFRVIVPSSYVGKSLAESQIRTRTGCNVIAIYDKEIENINPSPSFLFTEENELILIGDVAAEGLFYKLYSEMKKINGDGE